MGVSSRPITRSRFVLFGGRQQFTVGACKHGTLQNMPTAKPVLQDGGDGVAEGVHVAGGHAGDVNSAAVADNVDGKLVL